MSQPPARVSEPRARGQRPALSRPAVLRAALALLDREGADALTMRGLGSELGVEAMSLYRYVSSRDDLLDGVAELLMGEVEVDAAGGDWTAALRNFGRGVRSIGRAHPQAFALVGLRVLNTPDSLRPVERLLAALRGGGFAPTQAVAAYRLLASFARGYALIEHGGFTLAAGPSGQARLTADQLSASQFPALHALSRELAAPPGDSQFEFGLEAIIAGLRAELDGG